jgi:phosphatidylglycerophosphate synthase
MAHALNRIKKNDEFSLTRITYRKVSEPIAIILSKTSITPNQVSSMSILTSIITGIFFSLGEWSYLIIGYLFLQLTIILDHVDGNLARYTGTSNALGIWIDNISNKFHKFSFIFGASLGIFRLTNNPFYLMLGFAAMFNWIFAGYISETKTRFDIKGSEKSKRSIGQFLNQMPMALIVINIFGFLVLINNAKLALWFVTIVNLIWIKHIYGTRKLWRRRHNS